MIGMHEPSPYFTLDDLQRWVDFIETNKPGVTLLKLRMSHATRRHTLRLDKLSIETVKQIEADRYARHGYVVFVLSNGDEVGCFPAEPCR